MRPRLRRTPRRNPLPPPVKLRTRARSNAAIARAAAKVATRQRIVWALAAVAEAPYRELARAGLVPTDSMESLLEATRRWAQEPDNEPGLEDRLSEILQEPWMAKARGVAPNAAQNVAGAIYAAARVALPGVAQTRAKVIQGGLDAAEEALVQLGEPREAAQARVQHTLLGVIAAP